MTRGLILTIGVWCAALVPGAAAAEVDALRTKEFLVMGYEGLQHDLASGRGPYVATLMDLLQVPPDRQGAAIARVQSAAASSPNIMDFADRVLAVYVSTGTAARGADTAAPLSSVEALPAGIALYSGDGLENALRHLGKGMRVTVYLKTGLKVSGAVSDYDAGRLSIRTPAPRTFKRDDIRALEAPEL